MNYINDEKVWVKYMNDGEITHIITSDKNRENYFLYTVKNGKPKKTAHKSADPLILDKYIKTKTKEK